MAALSPELLAALKSFARIENILVALDFDGTLSPLVDVPQDARPLPQSADLVEQLGRMNGVHTAVVSGRNLDSLRQVYPEPAPTIRIGSHGAERVVPEALAANWSEQPLDAAQAALLGTLTQRLREVASRHDNVSLEFKPSATVLHVRQASAETGATALSEARDALDDLVGVKLINGKAVLEATVHQGNKGQALTWLREVLDVGAVLFIGDDVTDENGFQVLGKTDLGIKVGDGSTAATHRIGSPHDIPVLLETLVRLRATLLQRQLSE